MTGILRQVHAIAAVGEAAAATGHTPETAVFGAGSAKLTHALGMDGLHAGLLAISAKA